MILLPGAPGKNPRLSCSANHVKLSIFSCFDLQKDSLVQLTSVSVTLRKTKGREAQPSMGAPPAGATGGPAASTAGFRDTCSPSAQLLCPEGTRRRRWTRAASLRASASWPQRVLPQPCPLHAQGSLPEFAHSSSWGMPAQGLDSKLPHEHPGLNHVIPPAATTSAWSRCLHLWRRLWEGG